MGENKSIKTNDPLWVGQPILGLKIGGPTRKGSCGMEHRLPPVVRG